MPSDLVLTVLVPALNEEKGIRRTLDEVCSALDATFPQSEVLTINDGSTDATEQIMKEAASQDGRIVVIPHDRPMGLGADYWEAIQKSRAEFLVLVPGDSEVSGDSIRELFAKAHTTDIVSCYATNPQVRERSRQIISKAYVILINTLFGYRLKYYNGPCLVRVSLMRQLKQPTTSFAYMTEIMLQLLDRKATITEIGMTLRPRPSGKTKAFKIKNVIGVVQTIGGMFWKLRVKKSTT